MYSTEDNLFIQLIVATLVVGGIIAFFIYSMVRQFRHYRQLQDRSNSEKIETLEQERKVIAADLHDDIGPLLSATLFKLGEIEPHKETEKTLLDESKRHIDSIFSRIRDLSSMLVPRSIQRKGPLYALEEFNDLYKGKHSLCIEIIPVTCKGLSAFRSLHLFRMLQEIMHNAIRHSKAERLIVAGEVQDNKLVIQTSDNGIGFEHSPHSDHPGLGLENLRLRAKMIGATLLTETGKGKGTQYKIELFLKDE
jgi:two-component system, NarL family, sensor kinase